MTPDAGIVILATSSSLSLYPNHKLAEDVGPKVSQIENKNERFPGFTFGHCVRRKEEVNAILLQAQKAGGKIVKDAQDNSGAATADILLIPMDIYGRWLIPTNGNLIRTAAWRLENMRTN